MRSGDRGSVRLWAYPILLAGVALGFDTANRRLPYGLISTGPLDEVAHLATAALGLLVLACFLDVPRRFYVAALIASVAIDLDHIPPYLGLLPDRGQRPVTHSLATVAVLAGAAAVSRRHRAVLAGAVTGLVLHFARDIAEGPPGVQMLWPLQQTAWTEIGSGGRQPPPSGRAGRGGNRAGAPLRPGYRRGPARGADALAPSADGMDRDRERRPSAAAIGPCWPGR